MTARRVRLGEPPTFLLTGGGPLPLYATSSISAIEEEILPVKLVLQIPNGNFPLL
jgi:hypothetical protein